MLRFQEPPDEISLAILQAALADASDWIDDNHDDPEDFTRVYPESVKCFTPQLAKKTIKRLMRFVGRSAAAVEAPDSLIWQAVGEAGYRIAEVQSFYVDTHFLNSHTQS
jgi:hypothetical protein